MWNERSSHSISPCPRLRLFEPIGEDGRPGVHRRVDVAEVPLVRGNLPARVEIAFLEHQVELLLAEVFIHHRQREHVEGEVPRGVPRVLPLVGHREHVGVEHVMPAIVARGLIDLGLNGSAPRSESHWSTS